MLQFFIINRQMTDVINHMSIVKKKLVVIEKDWKMKQLLTEREKSVLFLLAQGMKNDEISEKLHISVHTTKAHLEMIYEKLGVKNRVQAAIKAIELGFFTVSELVS